MLRDNNAIEKAVAKRSTFSIHESQHGKTLMADFGNNAIHNSWPLRSFKDLLDTCDSVLISTRFPTIFILDVMFLISTASLEREVLLTTSKISKRGFEVLKRLGLSGHGRQPSEASIIAEDRHTYISEKHNHTIDLCSALTVTEMKVLFYLSHGLNNTRIADSLSRSYHTIKNHKLNIVRKSGLDHCNQLFELILQIRQSFY